MDRNPMRGWLRVVLIILPFFIFVVISQILASLVLGIKLSERHLTPTLFQSTVSMLFFAAGTFSVVAIFRRWIDRESFRSLGFGLQNVVKESVIGILMGIGMMVLGFGMLLVLNEIKWVGINPDAGKILLSVVLFVIVAFNEELLFRGYILGNLMLSMNRWVALLVSSFFFALVHMGNAHITLLSFFSILFAGLLLGLPYIFTRSLWLPLALHFSWNYFQGTIFGFSVSGNAEYSLITQTRQGDTMLNGGAFGFEGSILAVVFLAIAIASLSLYYHRQERLTDAKKITETAPIAESV
jgi:uncharacterized protein